MSACRRRQVLQSAVVAGATASCFPLGTTAVHAEETWLKGNIRHSVVFWCFNIAGEKWDIDKDVLRGEESGLRVGGNLRAGNVGHAQEARPGVRHRPERDARRALHEGAQ